MDHTIVIGDIHGCAQEFEDLLNELQPRPTDTIILVGDLINRGPDPHGVFDIVRSLPNVRCMLGNHEVRLLKYKTTKDTDVLKPYDWQTIQKLTASDWELMKKMEGPIFLEYYNTLIAHGGFLPDQPWDTQPLSVTTRIQVVGPDGKAYKRSECKNGTPWFRLWQGPHYVIYGHIPRIAIERTPWTLGIDTGCVLGGHLTACILPEKEIVQVPARKKHYDKPLLY